MIVLTDDRKREFTTLAFGTDGNLVAAGGGDKSPALWDATTGREVTRLDWVTHQVAHALVFHPKGKVLYVATNNGLLVYRLADWTGHKLLGRSDYTRHVAVSPTGQHVVWYHVVPKILVRDVLPLLTCADVSSEAGPQQVWERPEVDPPGQGRGHRLAFLPDGSRFVAVEGLSSRTQSDGPRITIRATDTGNTLHCITGPDTQCDDLAMSPRGDLLATRLKTTIHILDLQDYSARPRVLKHDNRKHFTGIAFHPSGGYLAATSNDATVKFYETATWELARTFTWDIGRMRSIAFSADGTLAAAGSDTGKVVVWDVDV